jgi:hypothetical protein
MCFESTEIVSASWKWSQLELEMYINNTFIGGDCLYTKLCRERAQMISVFATKRRG